MTVETGGHLLLLFMVLMAWGEKKLSLCFSCVTTEVTAAAAAISCWGGEDCWRLWTSTSWYTSPAGRLSEGLVHAFSRAQTALGFQRCECRSDLETAGGTPALTCALIGRRLKAAARVVRQSRREDAAVVLTVCAGGSPENTAVSPASRASWDSWITPLLPDRPSVWDI